MTQRIDGLFSAITAGGSTRYVYRNLSSVFFTFYGFPGSARSSLGGRDGLLRDEEEAHELPGLERGELEVPARLHGSEGLRAELLLELASPCGGGFPLGFP